MDMIVLIEEIADYIIPEDNEIRKGLGEIMGGKILKLRSEELLEQGRIDAIQNMIDLGLTKEQILKKYSLEEYEKALNSMSVKVWRNPSITISSNIYAMRCILIISHSIHERTFVQIIIIITISYVWS